MEVNDAMVNKLATLARLRFNDTEKEAIRNDLEKMILFVQKMNEVDTSTTEPLLHMSPTVNVMREDEIKGSCSQEQALSNAGLHNKEFFMVPKVIKK